MVPTLRQCMFVTEIAVTEIGLPSHLKRRLFLKKAMVTVLWFNTKTS